MTVPKNYPVVTVGFLKRQLDEYPDDFTIDFCGLEYYRVKRRGDTHVQLEFSQPVYVNDVGHVVVQNLE